MSGEVCKVFIVKRWKEAGYKLSVEERNSQMGKGAAALKECGGRTLVNAYSRWCTYDNYAFGAEIFPDMEAVVKYSEMLEKADWFRYVEGEIFLGTPFTVNEPTAENAIYSLQLIHGPGGRPMRSQRRKSTAAWPRSPRWQISWASAGFCR